ncbi:MAG: hypothetical protein JXC33_06135 [Deltaproteobacteria bacterium]|nr:hypothetical protein [Deltaproteobacteria bacterium]
MGANKGFFLHDFFRRILPEDRNLFTPILEFLKWRQLTRNLGLLSWVALWLAVCGLLTFSFMKNISVLHGFTQDFSKPPALTKNISDNLIVMDKFRTELLELHDANQNWWIPRFGLRNTLDVEKRLTKQYVDLFETGFVKPMNRMLQEKMAEITADTPGNDIMVYAEHLVGRIKLTQAYIEGGQLKKSQNLINALSDILILLDRNVQPATAEKFRDIYLYYLDRGIDKKTAQSNIKKLQTELVQLIYKKSEHLNWLVKWANNDVTIRDIKLDDYWGPDNSQKSGDKIIVDGAFTENGFKEINEFIGYLEGALPGYIDITEEKKKFLQWYQKEYFQAWKYFANSFSKGQFNLGSPDDWQNMASEMTTPHNPYFDLIESMSKQLKPFADGKNVPEWVKQIIDVKSIIDYAAKEKSGQKETSIMTRAVEKGEKLVHDVVKEAKALTDKEREEQRLYAAKTFNAYLAELENLLPVSTARSQAYKAASEFFPYSLKPSESKSPFFSAFGEVQKFENYLSSGSDFSIPMNLISGPALFLLFYVSMETACSLQHDWEDIVLGGIQGVAPEKLPDLLFSEKGVVWKFVNGPAAPFLGRNQHGYYAKKARGARIPFENSFFSFITRGAEVSTSLQPDYNVQIRTLPIDVNDSAKKEPYQVSIELGCVKGKTRLDNFNHPAGKMFTWSPGDCGDLTLQIYFEGLTLTKKYSGHDGFPLFLTDFKDGSKTFTPEDFHQAQGILKELNVTEIKVSYEITDSKPVIKLMEKVPRQTPTVIADCWGQ